MSVPFGWITIGAPTLAAPIKSLIHRLRSKQAMLAWPWVGYGVTQALTAGSRIDLTAAFKMILDEKAGTTSGAAELTNNSGITGSFCQPRLGPSQALRTAVQGEDAHLTTAHTATAKSPQPSRTPATTFISFRRTSRSISVIEQPIRFQRREDFFLKPLQHPGHRGRFLR